MDRVKGFGRLGQDTNREVRLTAECPVDRIHALSEIRGTDIRNRLRESRSVGEVVHLATEFQVEAIPDAERFEQRNVVILGIRAS